MNIGLGQTTCQGLPDRLADIVARRVLEPESAGPFGARRDLHAAGRVLLENALPFQVRVGSGYGQRISKQLLSKRTVLGKDHSRLESARGDGVHELRNELLVNWNRGIRLQVDHGAIDATRGRESIQLF